MIADEVKIGTYVYLPYKPQTIGKIIKIEKFHGKSTFPDVDVQWTKPDKQGKSITRIWAIQLQNIENLIADHEKKLETHRKNLEKAKLILGEI